MLDYKTSFSKEKFNCFRGKNEYFIISLFRALVFGKFIYMYII